MSSYKISYKIYGWQLCHWQDLRKTSNDLFRCAADLDLSIASGEDALEPVDVLAFARRLEIISRRLRGLADDY